MRISMVLLLLALPSSAAADGFTFRVPEGFTDLLHAPPSLVETLPAQTRDALRSGTFAALAVDLGHADERGAANFNATVGPGSGPIDERLLSFMTTHAAAEVDRQMPGARLRVTESGFVQIHGVKSIRYVADMHMGDQDFRQVQYLVPGGREYATITYGAPRDRFDSYRPMFEAAVADTGGARPPVAQENLTQAWAQGALASIVVGTVVGIGTWLWRARRRPS